MNTRTRILFYLNAFYSRLWIAVTGLDKYEYRERSLVHHLLVSLYRIP